MKNISPHSRVLGGMIGLVVGDALGVPVEFESRETLKTDPVTRMRGHGTHNQPPGTWSDDSSLALVTLESLLSGYDLGNICERFHRWLFRGYMTPHGKAFDVGHTTREAIFRYASGKVSPEDCGGTDEHNNGNGSIMRILPVSLYASRADEETLIARSCEVSRITHGHIRAQLCCAFYSLVVKAAMQGYDVRAARAYAARSLAPRLPDEERHRFRRLTDGSVQDEPEERIQSSGYVLHTLEASIWCCSQYEGFEQSVLAAVNLGGDTDTTGSVTGGLAGVVHGIEQIPQSWIEALARRQDVWNLVEAFALKLAE